MQVRSGPSYREWLDVLEHAKNATYDELHAIAERIDAEGHDSRLTQGQRAELLRKLGDLQIAAAQREEIFHGDHSLRTGPAMS